MKPQDISSMGCVVDSAYDYVYPSTILNRLRRGYCVVELTFLIDLEGQTSQTMAPVILTNCYTYALPFFFSCQLS